MPLCIVLYINCLEIRARFSFHLVTISLVCCRILRQGRHFNTIYEYIKNKFYLKKNLLKLALVGRELPLSDWGHCPIRRIELCISKAVWILLLHLSAFMKGDNWFGTPGTQSRATNRKTNNDSWTECSETKTKSKAI